MKNQNIESDQFKKVVLLSEKSEKILIKFSETLKESKFTALMGMVSNGAPVEVIKALEDFQQCNAFFKRELMQYKANQGEC
ncbi:hypothetical protein [Psychromonas sp. Urea-02u-13]|uniref:hypothetical protein n=1 Tax=Psychromonas sp. Urea-02u-13 TaxID=2058326 RepID=UPI000C34AA39|nr:hypothetical protein [Psychromonas sp. Urea-02u-13]PKG39710.1 hypothetical protein CXF74_07090 [Psychromonas sp. Urea-02u-13]